MNSVDLVKSICKERKIPISRLERDLGYANGYIGQLRKGVFPTDRLVEIANYLQVSTAYLMGENENKPALPEENELTALQRQVLEQIKTASPAKLQAIIALLGDK